MASFVARPEDGSASQCRLLAAARFLAERETYGLVWLNRELVVVDRYGALVHYVDLGQPIVESFPAFIGYEDEITGLVTGEAQHIAAL